MSAETGTLEQIALVLGQALSQLEQELKAGNLKSVLAQLGLALPDAFAIPPAVETAMQTVATAAGQLPPAVAGLITAIENADYGQIASKGLSILDQVKVVIQAIDAAAPQLQGGLGGAGIAPAALADFAAKLSRQLVSYILVRWLEDQHPLAMSSLALSGLIERKRVPNAGGAGSFLRRDLRLDRIASVIGQPESYFRTLYSWGDPGFDGRELLGQIASLLRALSVSVGYDDAAPVPSLDILAMSITPGTWNSKKGLSVALRDGIPGGWQASVELGGSLSLDLKLDAALQARQVLNFVPPGEFGFQPAAQFQGAALVGLSRAAAADDRFTLLGPGGGSGILASKLGGMAGADFTWDTGTSTARGDFALSGEIKNGKFVLDFSNADGLVGKLLSAARVEADFDIGIDWSMTRGMRFRGSSALDIKMPSHISLGPISINALTLTVGTRGSDIEVAFSADVGAKFAVLDIVIQEIGAKAIATFPANGVGAIGPLNLAFAFKPPKGAGLAVDTDVVKGGGFMRFDPDKGEYFGALELSFKNVIDLKAFGIINTKFPDGHKGFAFLVLVTAEFAPIQLSFGFTLIGVGGLLSLNRTLDTEALRTGVRTGAVNSILFPQDIVANIDRIASDIRTIFPLAEGHFVIAPMGKLGWGTPTLISLELGVILDIPEPQITFLGVLRCALPTDDEALLVLQVNFAGGIDFSEGLIWFDASLFESRIVMFTLMGDMALRIGFGSKTFFVLSVGGFHPAYKDTPDDLRGMKRISIALLSGDNPRIMAQTYFAVTSNTYQTGAKVELYAEAAGFNIYGYLGYDLLIQFDPFHFIADLHAGLALRRGDDVIAGITLDGQLSGPAPWNAHGEAALKILFFKVKVPFDVTWGDDTPPQIVEVENVTKLLTDALNDDRNWRADNPVNSTVGVSVRQPQAAASTLVIQPFSVIGVSQKVVPLDFPLQRFGNKKPDAELFSLTSTAPSPTEMREEFAIANFKNISDSEKLSVPSFERMKSGLTFTGGAETKSGTPVVIDVEYALSYVHRRTKTTLFAGLRLLCESFYAITSAACGISRNAFSKARDGAGIAPATVVIAEPQFVVVSITDLQPHPQIKAARSMAEAWAAHDALVAAEPAMQGSLQVVARHELEAA